MVGIFLKNRNITIDDPGESRFDALIKKYPLVLAFKNSIIGLVIVIGLAYFILVSATRARNDLKEIFSEEKSDVTTVENVTATGYDFEEAVERGEKKQYFGKVWELESRIVQEGQEGRDSIAKEIKVLRVYKEGKLNLRGIANEAVYSKNREELTMKGKVHIESEDGSTILDTEELTWRESTKEMSCPKPVDIWVEDNHILADMLFTDKDMERLDFLGRVSMHIKGIEGENFMTREGWINYEDVRSTEDKDPDDVINVESEFVHYDKVGKFMECYPYVPHSIKKKYFLYLRREDYKPAAPLKYEPDEEKKPEQNVDIPKNLQTTGMEGFEGIFKKPGDKKKEVQGPPPPPENQRGILERKSDVKNAKEAKPPEKPLLERDINTLLEEEALPRPERQLRASPEEEPYPGKFPDRIKRQVYCWKQTKKIFSDRLDIDLEQKMLKPRFDVYIWAFDFKREVEKKHEREKEEPNKTVKALSKDTTEIFGDFINVYWKTDFMDAWGGVEVRQKEKLFQADSMTYSDKIGLLQAFGNVFMNQLDGKWLEREGLLEDVTDEKAKEDAKRPTDASSDAMISFDSRDYVYMTGNVYIKQENQNILADDAEFDDTDDMLTMTGNVIYRSKDGERLDADKLILYTKENRYVAEGHVKARSLVPEEYEKDLKEIDKERTKPAKKQSSGDKSTGGEKKSE